MGDPTDCGYQLRRIGPPKSLEEVQDIMRFSHGCAKFGRSYLKGGPNEFFLDSAKIKNFISRRHAEIYVQADGECILVDLGLNGTYVNDIRVDGKCLLHVGDRVTFGHTRGMSIKPGSFAPEPDSEFQFIPIKGKIPLPPEKASVPSVTSPIPSSPFGHIEEVLNQLFSFQLRDNSELERSTEEEGAVCKIELKFEHPDKCENIPDQPECNVDEDCASRRDNHDKQVSSCEQWNHVVSPTVFLRTSEDDNVVKNIPLPSTCSESKDDSVIVLEISDESDSDNKECSHSSDEMPKERSDSGHPSHGSDMDQQAYVVLCSSDDFTRCEASVSNEDATLFSESTPVIDQEEDEENSGSPVIPNMSNLSQTPILHGKQEILGCKLRLTFPEAASPEHLQGPNSSASLLGDAGFESCSASENDDDSVDGNVTLSMVSEPRKPLQRTSKGRGRRKKRFKKTTDNEDEVQWYEVATCAAVDCRKPDSDRIGWVQCDSCDEWYHTSCAGCTYQQVRHKDIEFHCGCV